MRSRRFLFIYFWLVNFCQIKNPFLDFLSYQWKSLKKLTTFKKPRLHKRDSYKKRIFFIIFQSREKTLQSHNANNKSKSNRYGWRWLPVEKERNNLRRMSLSFNNLSSILDNNKVHFEIFLTKSELTLWCQKLTENRTSRFLST